MRSFFRRRKKESAATKSRQTSHTRTQRLWMSGIDRKNGLVRNLTLFACSVSRRRKTEARSRPEVICPKVSVRACALKKFHLCDLPQFSSL